jgi:capsular polysaccharide transport system permease protein
MRTLWRRWGLFGVLVILPTLAATVYFGLVASDIYESESRFVVRSAEQPESVSGIAAMFKNLGSSGSGDVFLVRDYLLSRRMARDLDQRLGLRKNYRIGDVLTRFPAPWGKHHAEAFYLYYLKNIQILVDPDSSVAVLTVSGFDPQLVQRINTDMMAAATEWIGRLNTEIRTDTLTQAQTELSRAEADRAKAEARLAAYRRANAIIDPEKQAAAEVETEQQMLGRLVAAKAQLAQVQTISPQSPQLPGLRSQIASLENALEQLRAKLASKADGSRAQMSEAFHQLTLERDIAARVVAAAHEASIRAKLEVERRHLYLEVVSEPTRPEGALAPRRARSILAIFLLGIALWGVASLIWSSVREHQDAV